MAKHGLLLLAAGLAVGLAGCLHRSSTSRSEGNGSAPGSTHWPQIQPVRGTAQPEPRPVFELEHPTSSQAPPHAAAPDGAQPQPNAGAPDGAPPPQPDAGAPPADAPRPDAQPAAPDLGGDGDLGSPDEGGGD